MVKKELTNKKVVRAIALGLSAVMLTTPMTAMAHEAPVVDPDAGTTEAEEQPSVTEKVSNVITEANVTAGVVATAGNKEDEAVKLGTDGTSEKVNAAAEKLDDINGTDGNDADAAVGNAIDDLDDAKTAAGDTDLALNEAEDATDDARDAANSAKDIVADAKDDIADSMDAINGATSIEDAAAELDEVENTLDEAGTALEAARTDYATAKENYNKAAEKAAKAQEEYKAALEAATGETDAALAELAEAAEAAKVLADEAEAAKNAAQLDAAQKAALAIIDKENAIAAGGKNDWANLDVLFNMVMEDYFIPNVIKPAEGTTFKLDDKFTKFSDDSKNYIKCVFTDANGNESTVYYNYKLEDGKTLIIFEKTWEDIVTTEAQPEQYVVYNETGIARAILASDLQAKIDAKEVVQGVDGNYYAKAVDANGVIADSVDSYEIELDDNQTTGNVSAPVYSVNQDGQIVKTVTGDVTTVTMTEDVALNGGSGFESKEAAEEAALAEAQKAIADSEAKDALVEGTLDVNVESTTTDAEAQATVTYHTSFTTTINITGYETTVDSADWNHHIYNSGYWTEVERVKEKIRDEIAAELRDNEYVLEDIVYNEFGAFEYTDFGRDDKYKVSEGSSVTITFKKASVQSVTVTETKYDADGETAEEAAEKAAKDKATVAAKKADTHDAKKAAKEVKKALVGNKGGVDVDTKATFDEVTSDVTKETETTWSYTGTYDKTTTTVENNVVLETETWDADELTKKDAVAEVTTPTLTNKNYDNYKKGDKTGILFFEKSDENFAAYKQAALKAKADVEAAQAKYQAIKDQADAANVAVVIAQGKVEALQKQIESLKGQVSIGELKLLEAQLDAALAKLELAESDYKDLQGQLDEAQAAYDAAVIRLTPAPSVGGDDDGDEDDGDDEGTIPVVPVATPVVLAETPVAPVAVAAVGAGQAVVNIDDEATPLAAGIGDGNDDANAGDDEVIVAQADDDAEQAIVAIEDEETPLAAGVGADAKMSWWWLLIVALFGAAGYKMYKDHQKKKEETQES